MEWLALLKEGWKVIAALFGAVVLWKGAGLIRNDERRKRNEEFKESSQKALDEFLKARNNGHDINGHFGVQDGRKWTPRKPADP